jgi:hypothetical protein
LAISIAGYASALSDSLTLPGHQKGDLIAIGAFRTNTTGASLPSGWISVSLGGASNLSLRVGLRIAQSSTETSGTWTNATGLSAIVLRPSAGSLSIPTSLGPTNGSTTTVTYQSITGIASADGYLDQTYIAFGSTLDSANAIETTPTGWDYLEKQSQTGLAFALFARTTNAFGNLAATTVTLANAAQWRTATVRITEYPFPSLASGGVRMVNIRGGADQ